MFSQFWRILLRKWFNVLIISLMSRNFATEVKQLFTDAIDVKEFQFNIAYMF